MPRVLLTLNNGIERWVPFGYHCVIGVTKIGNRGHFSTVLDGFIKTRLGGLTVAAGMFRQVSEVGTALPASPFAKLPPLLPRAQGHLLPQLTKLILLGCLL